MPRPPDNIQQALAALAELAWQAGPPPPSAPPDVSGTDGDGEALAPSRARRHDAISALAETQYRTLIEQIPAVTFVASLGGSGSNQMYVSPQIEELLGYSQREWVSDPLIWYRATHPDDRGRVSSKFAKTLSTGLPFRDVFRVRAKAGRTLWIDAEARFVRDEDGHLLFLQGVGFNVTEQVHAREAREELIRAQAARSEAERARLQVEEALRVREEFFHVASHELRTPITSLLGQAQLAKRRLQGGTAADPAAISRSLDVIVHQARRLSLLIGQLLDISRLEGGKLAITPETTDLVPLVDQAIETAGLLSERHTLKLEAPALLEVDVDPPRFEQVLTNLIDNAIKYSPRGGDIDIALSSDGQKATLAVRDRGLGIPPDRRGRIFERFYQAHGEHAGGGLGLGLFITKQIVDLHGGTIRAEFPEDGGTRFVVELPLRHRPDQAAGQSLSSAER